MLESRFWPTAAEIADDVRAQLAAGDPTHALRLLMDGVNRLERAHSAGHLDQAISQAPGSTGDEAWDALLAGAIRYRTHSLGERAPAWTYKKPLARFWWPVAHSPSQAYIDMAHAPAELVRLGIFLDEREFNQA